MKILGLFGPPNVEKLKGRGNVDGLVKALSWNGKGRDEIKAAAMDALVELAEPEPLIALFYQADEELRAASVSILARIGAPAVDALANTLGDSGWEMRRAAVQALGGIEDSRAVNAIVGSLRDTHARVRESASDALTRNASSDVTVLAAALDGADDQTRERLVTILGNTGDARAVEPLIAAFRDGSGNVRSAAGQSLEKLGGLAVDSLLLSLKDPDEEVRRHSATTLGNIGDARALGPLVDALGDGDWSVRRASAEALGKLGDAQAVDALTGVLTGDVDEDVSAAAATALGLLRDERAVAPLMESLNQESWTLRRAVIGALGNIGGSAVDRLVASLGNMDDSVREAAVEILGDIGDTIVNPLIDVLRDGDASERRAAAIELGEARESQAVDALIDALANADEGVRSAASTALGQIGDERAAEPLVTMLDDSSESVRDSAISALVMTGAPAVPALLASLESSEAAVLEASASVLGQIGDTRAVRPLFALLNNDERSVRMAAAHALSSFGGRVFNALAAALEGEDERIREAVAVALGEIGDERAVKPLLDALKSSKDRNAQLAAARALGSIGRSGIDTLIAELGNVFWDVRFAAATALGETGDERAIQPLQAVLNDQERAVRTAAGKSLEQLGANQDG
jgi:HEAT repeat protein